MLACVHTEHSAELHITMSLRSFQSYHMLQDSIPKVLHLNLVATLDKLQGHLNRVPSIGTLQLRRQYGQRSLVQNVQSHQPPVKHGLVYVYREFCLTKQQTAGCHTVIPDPKPQQPDVAGFGSPKAVAP